MEGFIFIAICVLCVVMGVFIVMFMDVYGKIEEQQQEIKRAKEFFGKKKQPLHTTIAKSITGKQGAETNQNGMNHTVLKTAKQKQLMQ